MKKHLALVLLLLLLTACAKAPTDNTQPTSANNSEPRQINSVDVVKANPQEITLARGASGQTLVRLQIANGYHVNANPPSQPYLKATELEFAAADGISVDFIAYPDPLVKKFSFSDSPLKVYEGATDLKVSLSADTKATSGKHNLLAKLRVQACDDKVCYAPGALDLTVPVNIK